MARCGNRRPRNPTTWGASTYTFKQYFALLGLATHASRALDQPISLRQPGHWRMGPHSRCRVTGSEPRSKGTSASWQSRSGLGSAASGGTTSGPHAMRAGEQGQLSGTVLRAPFSREKTIEVRAFFWVWAGIAPPGLSPSLVELTSAIFHLPSLRNLASHRMRPRRLGWYWKWGKAALCAVSGSSRSFRRKVAASLAESRRRMSLFASRAP